jgi:hypothetical protein
MSSSEQLEYNKTVEDAASKALALLKSLSLLMKQHGDEVRSMDIDEAIGYIEAAIES